MATGTEKQPLLSSVENAEAEQSISSSIGSARNLHQPGSRFSGFFKFGLHCFPLAVFIFVPLTFIITYAIAVGLNHVEPGFPYISDTAAISPESCIFSQLINMCTVAIAITMFIRYEQCKLYDLDIHSSKINLAAFIIGLIAVFGMSLVANFQETNVLVVHFTGAILAFGLGTVYAWLQSVFSYRTIGIINLKSTFYFRTVLACICTVTFITMFICTPISMHQFDGKTPRKWLPKDAGFTLHIVSTVSEWTMAVSFLMFFLTYVFEFKSLRFEPPKIHHVQSEEE